MLRNRQAPSRASPQTLCQKCLKKDDYKCKATIQDRPYRARPSRSQQLLNPKLIPKLSSDQPNELLRREGIADEQLAKAETERKREEEKQRDRSISTSSVDTVSTKGSLSPRPRAGIDTTDISHKRRRQSSSSAASISTSDSSRVGRPSDKDRNLRRRHSSLSPAKRGRNSQPESSSRRRTSSRRYG